LNGFRDFGDGVSMPEGNQEIGDVQIKKAG
jgi:hypothetical protein